jgi:hypothetical protein
MGRRATKQRKTQAVILPPDLDEDEEIAGGGIPDEDGWIYLRNKRKEKASGEETPKRKPGSKRA